MSTNGYIGINSVARKIKTMYVGVDGLARKVKTAYVGVNGVARKFYSSGVPEPPNDKYESKSLGTWSSTSHVDTFCATYNAQNGYAGLKLGNYVTIQDGTYNKQWEIAGFNLENNATASDGTTYDNGYGILMIPKTIVTTYNWHSDYFVATSYKDSDIHSYINSTAYNALATILGSHIIQRNVLLGSEQNGTSPRYWTTSNYTWTTSYLTLMSIGQCTGTFKTNCNQYDDGEANYKLPLFNYEAFKTGYTFWPRCVFGLSDYGYHFAFFVNEYGNINAALTLASKGLRPLMLIR